MKIKKKEISQTSQYNASFVITFVKLYLYMASIHLLYSLHDSLALLCAFSGC